MAYEDALFQLGMDLTRSSTAQKEDHALSAPMALVEEKDFGERTRARFAGTQLIIDLIGAHGLDDPAYIEAALKRCVKAAGAKLLHVHLLPVEAHGGVSGLAVLAEGQISLLSRPSLGYAAFDVFMGGRANPHLAIDVLKEAFEPTGAIVKEHLRTSTMARRDWEKVQKVQKRAPAREKARAAA
jgi:S-adenosylmethionine decarboxylase